ncbi:nucleoside diphosphate-linked moiety X motif 19 [Rana temporaria]|uniref:nucleoside diphosphate-linked moiety X motif 19 n=1 Tax=Rana temporaria TaxID=8407 RepID=UPI001AADC50B|nr:nucleoside diphosphate-linked moiety X motif 19 [Rana temporaria]
MNNTLQHWREAATLILAAGMQRGSVIPKMASQILQNDRRKSTFDYEVLLLKRSQKSGFMPNAFVFPGGVADFSDFSNDWIQVFQRHANKPNFGLGVVRQPPGTRSPMFVTDRMKFGSVIPGEVAFRICAIRETFEESGILLVVPDSAEVDANQDLADAYEQDGEAMAKWREEVQNNPLQFIEMCKEMRCVPNIWALHEWGNWLTPVFSTSTRARRFDTAFYIACLQKKPVTTDDQKEMASFNWWTPQEAIEEYRTQGTWIPPPQFYDLSRLSHFTSIHELHRFSSSRALEGCERWMPVLVHAEDGMVHTLPGDELYPEDPDLTEPKKYSSNKTIGGLVQEGGRLHRLLHIDGAPVIFINLQPKYKHVNPLLTDLSRDPEPKSKI